MVDWSEDPDMEDAQMKNKEKSPEEIERYTLSDSLTDLKKVLLLLTSGTSEQKQSVTKSTDFLKALTNLPRHIDDPSFIPSVMPVLCDAMQEWQGDMQQWLAETFVQLFQLKVRIKKDSGQVFKPDYAEKLMGLIFKAIENGYENVVNAWYPAFCVGIRSMDWAVFSEKVLPRVLKLAGLDYTYVTRNAAAQIITAAAIVAGERKTFGKLLLNPYLELCQDGDVLIRKAVLSNLKLLFQKIDPSDVEPLFFSDLVSHMEDPSASVRYIVIDVIVSCHRLLSTHCLRKDFVPHVIKEFELGWKDADHWLLQNFASVAGFLQEQGLILEEHVPHLAKFFDVLFGPKLCEVQAALHSSDNDIKRLAIRNIWPMVDVALDRELDMKYTSVINDLAINPDFQWAVLNALPDVYLGVVSSLGLQIVKAYHRHNKSTLIQPAYAGLMLQEDQSFVTALFRCVAKTASKLFVAREEGPAVEEQKVPGTPETSFRDRVLAWMKERWNIVKDAGRRDMCSFIEVIPQCQDSFPMPECNDFFLNEMVGIIRTGSKEAKRLASSTFCTLFLKNYFAVSRTAALGKVLAMGKSVSCFERLALLLFLEVASQYFSTKFISEQGLAKAYLSLGQDKVANVRIKFAAISLKMSKVIKNEEERKDFRHLLTLQETDLDKDVKRIAKAAVQTLKLAAGTTTQESAKEKAKFEEEDAAKEKREAELFTKEKEVEEAKKRAEEERKKLEEQYALDPEEVKKTKAYTKILQTAANGRPRRKSSEKVTVKPTGSFLPGSGNKAGEAKKKKVQLKSCYSQQTKGQWHFCTEAAGEEAVVRQQERAAAD